LLRPAVGTTGRKWTEGRGDDRFAGVIPRMALFDVVRSPKMREGIEES
jgi:hypothetical protein